MTLSNGTGAHPWRMASGHGHVNCQEFQLALSLVPRPLPLRGRGSDVVSCPDRFRGSMEAVSFTREFCAWSLEFAARSLEFAWAWPLRYLYTVGVFSIEFWPAWLSPRMRKSSPDRSPPRAISDI